MCSAFKKKKGDKEPFFVRKSSNPCSENTFWRQKMNENIFRSVAIFERDWVRCPHTKTGGKNAKFLVYKEDCPFRLIERDA